MARIRTLHGGRPRAATAVGATPSADHILGIALAVVVAILVIALVVVRRRRKR